MLHETIETVAFIATIYATVFLFGMLSYIAG